MMTTRGSHVIRRQRTPLLLAVVAASLATATVAFAAGTGLLAAPTDDDIPTIATGRALDAAAEPAAQATPPSLPGEATVDLTNTPAPESTQVPQAAETAAPPSNAPAVSGGNPSPGAASDEDDDDDEDDDREVVRPPVREHDDDDDDEDGDKKD